MLSVTSLDNVTGGGGQQKSFCLSAGNPIVKLNSNVKHNIGIAIWKGLLSLVLLGL